MKKIIIGLYLIFASLSFSEMDPMAQKMIANHMTQQEVSPNTELIDVIGIASILYNLDGHVVTNVNAGDTFNKWADYCSLERLPASTKIDIVEFTEDYAEIHYILNGITVEVVASTERGDYCVESIVIRDKDGNQYDYDPNMKEDFLLAIWQ